MAEQSKNIEVGDLAAEAAAFDGRISERIAAGFIPDLRRAVKCEYFYKSFWRDPQFIRLYVGKIVDTYLELLAKHCGAGQRILDVGCGAGYVSLELARNGHHVLAIDISAANIDIARRTLAENPFRDGFGSLRYEVQPFHEAKGEYDVVLFSVSLHHMPDVAAVVARARELVRPGGYLLCHEPCHERFGEQDAAQVALIRALLALTGHWYEPKEVVPRLSDEASFAKYVSDLQTEYVLERDPSEPQGQSPHDLEADGETMLAALRQNFVEREFRPGFSFIYRLLGGIRGPDATIRALADFCALYDRIAVERYGLTPNFFSFIGQRQD
ncbi:MAG: class I SAM-dependent methyltransferase [Alphaproteobacteria bacterium]|nr:class I SAM-dependent methyltransferase [Alphaproteobacteria bacterium]